MQITLYNSKAEKVRLNKSEYLHKIITMNGTLREACSVSLPSIVVELDPTVLQQNILNKTFVVDDAKRYATKDGSVKLIYDLIAEILTCNYAYIKEFNRYYFITDIISLNRNLWRLVMRVDGLMSFYGNIKNLDALVSRNEFEYNEMLQDETISYESGKDILYSEITNTADCMTFETHPNYPYINDYYNYVVSYGTTFQPVSTYIKDAPAIETLPYVSTKNTGNAISNGYMVLPEYYANHLAWEVFDDDTKLSFIKSMIAYPFNVPKILGEASASRIKITLGHDIIYLESEGLATGNYIPRYWASERLKFADFIFGESPDNYLKLNPYTRYMLYIPYVSYVEIPSEYLGHRIQVYYFVNYNDGTAVVIIYDKTIDKVIDTQSCQLGAKVALSSNNLREITDQKNALALNTAINLVGSIISIAGGVASSNPLAVAGGVMAGTKAIGNAITTNAQLYNRGNVQISSGLVGLSLPNVFHLKIESFKPVDDTGYETVYGKPLKEYRNLSTMKGFTICDEFHLEGFETATDSELNEIDTLLREGIII